MLLCVIVGLATASAALIFVASGTSTAVADESATVGAVARFEAEAAWLEQLGQGPTSVADWLGGSARFEAEAAWLEQLGHKTKSAARFEAEAAWLEQLGHKTKSAARFEAEAAWLEQLARNS